MAAAVASPPPRAPPQDAPPVTQLWDELCAAPQPPPPKRVVICGSTTRLVELARAALSDDEVQAECATVGCCAVSAVEGAETWQVVGRPAVAADLVRPESAVGGALRAASHSAAVVVVDGGHAPAAAFQSWLAALDGAPTLVIAFGGSRLGALRRRCGDAGVALAALREAGDATMRTSAPRGFDGVADGRGGAGVALRRRRGLLRAGRGRARRAGRRRRCRGGAGVVTKSDRGPGRVAPEFRGPRG